MRALAGSPTDGLGRSPRPLPSRRPRVPLYPIADAGALGLEALPEAVGLWARGGADWIQLRIKSAPDRERYRVAEACCEAVQGTGARLWIDDRVDLAALLPVAGVHLGQGDLPAEAAREVFDRAGVSRSIGASTHDREQVLAAHRDPAVDVVAVGPVFETASKERPDPVVGLELLAWARSVTDKPLVAIGGIGAENLGAVLAAGADAVALIGAVSKPGPGEDLSSLWERLLERARRTTGDRWEQRELAMSDEGGRA